MMQAGSGVLTSLLGVPNFLLYMVVGAALLALFMLVYVKITAHDELALIREGNLTASVALSGTMIGFVIPLAKAIAQAVSIPDMLIWGLAAFVVQLLAYVVIRTMVPGLTAKIESNTLAAGTLLAAGSIASGMLNAAAMTL
jgi:putative membrane protein